LSGKIEDAPGECLLDARINDYGNRDPYPAT
jgi:hypothetical protein